MHVDETFSHNSRTLVATESAQDTTTAIAIIPARGGSKAILRKNLVDLGGKPLIAWTIDAAHSAGVQPVVSSEDDEILAVAEAHGAETIRRPDSLAEDSVHAVHVVLDVLDRFERDGRSVGVVLMLLPTSPFRTAEHIREAVELFEAERPPAVISVEALDKQLIHLRQIADDGSLVPFLGWDKLTAQRQEQPPLYGLNGSIYVAHAAELRRNRTFHVPGALALVMPSEASVDINEPSDLAYARYLLETNSL